mmetsp:Transcript_57419/g.151128  ORF Transcript_57419/g.151128 Transcript_57419/m.151128 type:complete len:313 (+) Transcript_57419:990-1928(+)
MLPLGLDKLGPVRVDEAQGAPALALEHPHDRDRDGVPPLLALGGLDLQVLPGSEHCLQQTLLLALEPLLQHGLARLVRPGGQARRLVLERAPLPVVLRLRLGHELAELLLLARHLLLGTPLSLLRPRERLPVPEADCDGSLLVALEGAEQRVADRLPRASLLLGLGGDLGPGLVRSLQDALVAAHFPLVEEHVDDVVGFPLAPLLVADLLALGGLQHPLLVEEHLVELLPLLRDLVLRSRLKGGLALRLPAEEALVFRAPGVALEEPLDLRLHRFGAAVLLSLLPRPLGPRGHARHQEALGGALHPLREDHV